MVLPAFSTLSSIGSFASGLGSLASGLGIGGGKKKPPSRHAQRLDAGHDLSYSMQVEWDQKMKLAKKHGIHPLVAMGVNPTPTQGASIYSPDKKFDPASIGQGIDRALNAGRSSVQRKMDDLTLEKAKLENDYLKTQIAGSVKAISSTGQTPSYSGNQNMAGNHSDKLPISRSELVSIIKDTQITKSKKDSGTTAGNHSGFKQYDLGNGRKINMPYSEDGWAEGLGELPFFYKYPKMAELMVKRYDKYTPGYKLAKKWKKWKKSKK